MTKEKNLFINATGSEIRIALTEGEKLKTIIVEQDSHFGLIGNIYKGKVSKVLPGIQAAFIDIGLARSAFLYIDDMLVVEPTRPPESERETKSQHAAENILHDGQDVLVQVNKDPLGTKGARLTMHITLAGRYLVFLPGRPGVNLSKKITNDEERTRLLQLAQSITPSGHGVILRTAAEGISDTLIQEDLTALVNKWIDISRLITKTPAPAIIHQEIDVCLKTVRDLYNTDINKIIVDEPQIFQNLKDFLVRSIPDATHKLELFDQPGLLFDKFELEKQVSRALRRKVWLPSGGYLIIETTEALITFDVNTGRYTGESEARTTILNTNLEAAAEIAIQLELRNLGGIIVIDFIDMSHEEDRTLVSTRLLDGLKDDRAKTNVLGFSELGLVQLTRKRSTDSLVRIVTESCPTCKGMGRIANSTTEMNHLIREIVRLHLKSKATKISVKARSDIYHRLMSDGQFHLEELQEKYGVEVDLKSSGASLYSAKDGPYDISPG